jgi:predicted AAA+ superfamily ATPase
VSIAELASNLALDRQTVERYLDLLEKAFVIYKVSGFSRNLRKEIAKNSRYYFFDNGVRNALIENFNDLAIRNDVGQLWENFLAIERQKYLQAKKVRVNRYFWRTYDQKEIDLIEEKGGEIHGYEFKWRKAGIKKATIAEFQNAYPGSSVELITKDNFTDFI